MRFRESVDEQSRSFRQDSVGMANITNHYQPDSVSSSPVTVERAAALTAGYRSGVTTGMTA